MTKSLERAEEKWQDKKKIRKMARSLEREERKWTNHMKGKRKNSQIT